MDILMPAEFPMAFRPFCRFPKSIISCTPLQGFNRMMVKFRLGLFVTNGRTALHILPLKNSIRGIERISVGKKNLLVSVPPTFLFGKIGLS